MSKSSRVMGLVAGLLLLTGTMAASCSEDAAHDAPAVAHQAEIDLGHNEAETLNGSQLRTLLNKANLSENLNNAVSDLNDSDLPGEIRTATQNLAANAAEAVILNACYQENLPSTQPPPADADPSVSEALEGDLQTAVSNGGADKLAAYAICQAAVTASSPH